VSRRWLVSLGAATIAFVIAYAYPSFSPSPVAWYYPLDHAWAFEVSPSGLAMDFYGRVLQGLLAWIVAFVPVHFLVRRRQISTQTLGLVVAWMLTATVIAMLFYAWTLHYRIPAPFTR
jgi:hypothetical protein